MKLSYYKPSQDNIGREYTKRVYEFMGINYNSMVAEGEFRDTKNLSSDDAPCLTQRLPRTEIIGDLTSPTALFTKAEKIGYVDGTEFWYEGEKKGDLKEAGKKQIVTITNKIIIFPDKMYYDTSEDELLDMEVEYEKSGLVFTTKDITGTNMDVFRVGDAVEISGCTSKPANNKTAVISDITGTKITFADNTFVAGTESGTVTIKRKIPDLKYICESNNRIWGCDEANNIYASKLGDPLNFNVFQGLASDSYAVPVGTDGAFTGCVNYSNHIIFFKEDYMHKVFGTKPSNFQIQQAKCHGLQENCEKSIQTINESIFYKARVGIMKYDGGIPECITLNLGNKRYSETTSGSDGNKYYCCMKTGNKYEVFVYDVIRDIWLKEDEAKIVDFVTNDGVIYYIDGDKNKIYKMNDYDGDEVISWYGVLGEFTEYEENKKIYSKIKINVELETNSDIYIDIATDNGEYKNVFYKLANTKTQFTVPIIPQRCDTFSIKLYGNGKSIVKAIVREIMQGSDSQ